MKTTDCRGLNCPAPVIALKKALEAAEGEPVRIMVDGGAARENVLRYAGSKGCLIHEEACEGGWQLTLQPASVASSHAQSALPKQQSVILISSDRLGEGPADLGRLLMKNFIITLLELPAPPDVVYFINSGVHLTCEGSELLEPLGKLANTGTEIFSCGICLDYFSLREKLSAGGITNMFSIAEKMLSASITLKL